MNSRVTMGLAVILLIAALVAGYWGWMLSHQPAPLVPAQAPVAAPLSSEAVAGSEEPIRQPVVVLAHDVPAFVPLTAADLVIEKLRNAPAGSLGSLSEAVDRIPWRPLKAGTWLSDESFQAGGALARMIRADERALAVAVDEVIGAGGQLSPGDYVDVLLYLRQDASNLQQSAQVVIPAMRLLSVGDQLGLTNDGKPASPGDRASQDARRAAARTVVLAVPEQLLNRLMLATQVGTLRLAVRSADEHLLPRYWAGEQVGAGSLDVASHALFQFTQLALAGAPRGQPSTAMGASRASGVEVIRGNQTSQQTP
ncbi:Flp pilus assembly protein CpaB [Pseudomonas fuscovaginae UPB0736]|uniref:Flp pilus assembly protein CpaB n=1 Tax=Pseudomonas asplenii TaxID=53407 RepID=UPI000287A6A3|nr:MULTISPECIES: Flp pilus assembly protein CpaB [Pseudomonas]UUQ66982.1 Flp pilus assembly protein CpaB [Pseudomonas fuscovaginae UPB0736]UZE29750.1 Flp pilus assembly protein CpaB [Pseudomonas asplenii]